MPFVQCCHWLIHRCTFTHTHTLFQNFPSSRTEWPTPVNQQHWWVTIALLKADWPSSICVHFCLCMCICAPVWSVYVWEYVHTYLCFVGMCLYNMYMNVCVESACTWLCIEYLFHWLSFTGRCGFAGLWFRRLVYSTHQPPGLTVLWSWRLWDPSHQPHLTRLDHLLHMILGLSRGESWVMATVCHINIPGPSPVVKWPSSVCMPIVSYTDLHALLVKQCGVHSELPVTDWW